MTPRSVKRATILDDRREKRDERKLVRRIHKVRAARLAKIHSLVDAANREMARLQAAWDREHQI